MLKVPEAWIKAAKNAGVLGFSANSSVTLEPVREWIEANQESLANVSAELPLKDQKLAEEVRKLRLKNDKDSGKLVEISKLCGQFSVLGGRINAIEDGVLKEAPKRFAAAGDDIAKHREILRGVIAEFRAEVQKCAEVFK